MLPSSRGNYNNNDAEMNRTESAVHPHQHGGKELMGDQECFSIFPEHKINNSKATWRWVGYGKSLKESILVQFLPNRTVRWNKKAQKGSYWELISNKTVLKISAPILKTERHLKYNCKERKAVEVGSTKPTILWETVNTLLEYEERGKDLITGLYMFRGNRPIMCPPAPQHTYIDQYPDKSENHVRRLSDSMASNIQADNIIKQENYEAEVVVYRALEKLDEKIIVLHSFKCSFYQFKMCSFNFDPANISVRNSCECDFLVIGGNYYVVIEVKNSTLNGNLKTAFKKSIDQRNRIKMLIEGINQGADIFLFTAFPSLSKRSIELTKELDDAERVSVICKEQLDDFENFKKWWTANVTKNLRQNESHNPSLQLLHERSQHILITIFCTEVDVPDVSSLSFSKIVLKIDTKIKTGQITLEQKLKLGKSQTTQSINSDVVSAPDMVRDFVGVKYLTAEQNKVFTSKQKLLLIIGPAGSGKTVLLAGKMLHMIKAEPDKKVFVFKFSRGDANCTVYQDACIRAGLKFKQLSIESDKTGNITFKLLPENESILSKHLATNILKFQCSVIIVQLNDNAFKPDYDLSSESVFLNLLDESSVNVIIDDFHYNTADKIFGTLDMLLNYAHNNFVLMACDLPQFAACSLHIPFGTNLPYFRNYPSLSPDNCAILSKNLRNTRDISDVLSVIRSPFIEYAAAQGAISNVNLVEILLPVQTSGHFIRGPLTNFHIFTTFKVAEIHDLVNYEIVNIYKYDDLDKRHVAIVYRDPEDVENILFDVNHDRVTLCAVDESYSSEWPVVIVLFQASSSREMFIPAQLYLAVSRARVKCTVFLYPKIGLSLSDFNCFSSLLGKLEPIAHVFQH